MSTLSWSMTLHPCGVCRRSMYKPTAGRLVSVHRLTPSVLTHTVRASHLNGVTLYRKPAYFSAGPSRRLDPVLNVTELQ